MAIGIDLSGPANVAETALVCAQEHDDYLRVVDVLTDVGDAQILEAAAQAAGHGEAVIGLDAPLSYSRGGGDRPADAELRARTVSGGLPPGSVMPPTAPRMVYLTLRGMAIARGLASLGDGVRVVEVHPAAALVLGGARATDVRGLKRTVVARRRLLSWLEAQGVAGASALDPSSSHVVAACASSLAAWRWGRGRAVWMHRAEPPVHPYDFAC